MSKNPYITDSKNFAGIIEEDENGKRRLKMLSSDYYVTQLKGFKLGEQVTMYISSKKPKRSEAQNRYLWGAYYPIIAKETGEDDTEALHNFFKGEFLTVEIKEVMGKKVRITKSTTKLSKHEFSEFIEKIERLTGILAPPTEGYWTS